MTASSLSDPPQNGTITARNCEGGLDTSKIDTLIRRETPPMAPPLTPELTIHAATEMTGVWTATEADLQALNLPPPFWAFPWAAGQVTARHILDHPETVRGRRVAVLAAGAGLEAIAAAKSGAAHVIANDVDPVACRAIALNAALNGAALEVDGRDWLQTGAPEADLLIAADIFYTRDIADRLEPLLRARAAAGGEVWIADGGRPYMPAHGLEPLARHLVPTPVELEDAPQREAKLWRVRPPRRG